MSPYNSSAADGRDAGDARIGGHRRIFGGVLLIDGEASASQHAGQGRDLRFQRASQFGDGGRLRQLNRYGVGFRDLPGHGEKLNVDLQGGTPGR